MTLLNSHMGDGDQIEEKAKEVFSTLADQAYCINLWERDDRMKEVSKRLDKVGMKEVVQMHRVHRHEKGGRYGCFDSHRTIVKKAYEAGLERVLIFEDDVDFHDGWAQVVLDTKEFLDSNVHFDALLLGSRIHWVDEKTTDHIWRVKATNHHAYILSRSGMEGYLANDDMVEEIIQYCTQDLALNNAWQHIYAHRNTDAITQDPDLGTDNIWFKRMPPLYTNWMQNTVFRRMDRYLLPVIRTNLWRYSCVGRKYVVFTRTMAIDDGRVSLKPLPIFDFLFVFVFMMTAYPPRGYCALIYDILFPFFKRLFTGQLAD